MPAASVGGMSEVVHQLYTAFEARDWARRLRAVYEEALAGVPAEPVAAAPG